MSINRRNETRIPIRVPIRFRPITIPSSGEEVGESENLSQRGIFMRTSYPLAVGTQIELAMTMPYEVTEGAADVHCTARVVHVQQGTLLAKSGVGLHIEQYRIWP